MTKFIFENVSATIAELKKDPCATVRKGQGKSVLILNKNKPVFYCVPARLYEQILDRIDDEELVALIDVRKHEPLVEVDLEKYL